MSESGIPNCGAQQSAETGNRPAGMEPWARALLRCPIGGHELIDAYGEDGAPVLQCAQPCGGPEQVHQFPIRAGVPVLLADDAVAVPV